MQTSTAAPAPAAAPFGYRYLILGAGVVLLLLMLFLFVQPGDSTGNQKFVLPSSAPLPSRPGPSRNRTQPASYPTAALSPVPKPSTPTPVPVAPVPAVTPAKPDPDSSRHPHLFIGIPTILRNRVGASLVKSTIHSLLNGLDDEEKSWITIIVAIGERDMFKARVIEQHLTEEFEKEIKAGLLHLVKIPATYYPWNLVYDRCKLARNYNDKMARVLWRSKLVLDSCFPMEHVLTTLRDQVDTSKDWYLELEDDSPPNGHPDHWVRFLFSYEHQRFNAKDGTMGRTSDEWFMMRFYGPYKGQLEDMKINEYFAHSIAIIYKVKDLGPMVSYMKEHFDDRPLDWMIGQYVGNVIKAKAFQGPTVFTHESLQHSTSKDLSTDPPYDPEDLYNLINWAQCKK